MKVLKFLQEPLKENLRSLNRQCKRALRAVTRWPDPHYLYSLQLMSWALESGKYAPRGPLEAQVSLMFGWKPKEVVRYLEQCLSGDEIDLIDPGLKNPDPEELAGVILSEIEDKLSAKTGYPPLSKF